MREAMRRSIGREQPPPGGLCAGPTCNVVQSAAHARNCVRTGRQNFRHDDVKHAILAAVRQMPGLSAANVAVEDHFPFSAKGEGRLAMDITIAPNTGFIAPKPLKEGGAAAPPIALTAGGLQPGQRGVLLDVCLKDETAQTMRYEASKRSGAAALAGTKERFNTYPGNYCPATYTLFPLVVEHGGRIGPHAYVLLKAFASHEAAKTLVPRGQLLARWRQRFSIALQRTLSRSTMDCMQATRARDGPAAPRPDT